jgi:hypothetical protein
MKFQRNGYQQVIKHQILMNSKFFNTPIVSCPLKSRNNLIRQVVSVAGLLRRNATAASVAMTWSPRDTEEAIEDNVSRQSVEGCKCMKRRCRAVQTRSNQLFGNLAFLRTGTVPEGRGRWTFAVGSC